VLGPAAATARTLGGGSATVFPPYAVAPLEGIRAVLGGAVEVTHAAGVRAGTRIPPAPLAEGVQVRFLDRDGAALAAEQRRTSAFTWLGAFGPDLPIDRVAAVEVRARLRPAADGEHVLGCSGVGRFRLEVADEELFAERIEPSPGADIGEAVLRPPQHAVPVVLERDHEVELVLRHDLDEGARTAAFRLDAAPPQPPPDEQLERAVALARDADVAVVVVGTTEEDECEGIDRDSLALPGRQDELVRRVAGANPRTVVVVNAGAPVLLPWAGDVAAVLLAWFPGQEFGHALADVLLGAAEPGGRLPTTWPATEAGLPSTRPVAGVLRYDEGIFAGYRGYDRDGREPLFPFGHGLGYTDWEYLALEAERPAGGGATVRVRVRNAGPRPGREVVQVYLSRPGSAVERPPRWLGGFAIAEAGPGEEVTVGVRVAARAFEHWAGGWVQEPGPFVVEAGRSSRDLRLSGRA
jgi:beta-glucosidase